MILGIYCAGGFGGVTYSIAQAINQKEKLWSDICFVDDNETVSLTYARVLSFDEFTSNYSPENAAFSIAAGEPKTREYLFNKVKSAGYKLPNLIHPDSSAHHIFEIGEGNIVCAYGYISDSGVKLANNNILMPFAQISHDNQIGSHCVIASAANLSGTTRLEDRVYIGTGAKLRESINVGHDAVIGMGAIVTKSVDIESVVVGMPAKEIRKNTGKVFK